MSAPESVKAVEIKVGLSIVLTKATFDKLNALASYTSMEGWSAVITKLVERAAS